MAPNASKYAAYSVSLIRFNAGGATPSRSGWPFLLIMRVVSVGSFDPQELEQFRAGHEEFAPQHPTRTQFAALDHPIDAEIMDAQKLGGFLDGIGKPLCLCQSLRQRWTCDIR
jgi:hypothetical protein